MAKQEVYRSDYLVITYYEDTDVLYIKWLPDVLELLHDEFKEEIMQYLYTLDKTGAKKMVIDLLDASYPLTDELNQWIIDVITKGILDRNVKKVAHVYPKDYLTQLGFDYLAKNLVQVSNLTRKFTSSLDEAFEWIIQD